MVNVNKIMETAKAGTYFIAYGDLGKKRVPVYVTENAKEIDTLPNDFSAVEINSIEDAAKLPMKIQVQICIMAEGSAPMKFSNLKEGAERIHPHLAGLVGKDSMPKQGKADVVKMNPAKTAKTAKAAKPVKEAKPKGEGQPRMVFDSSKKIKINVTENPKRKNTAAFKYFEFLTRYDGKTVDEYMTAAEKSKLFEEHKNIIRNEIRWCLKQNFIQLV